MLRPLLDFIFAVVLNDYLFTGGEVIRLVNGLDSCFGTVEVMCNGTWGIVCDDGWDIDGAAEVCSQLGCGRAISAHGLAPFGAGSGDFVLSTITSGGHSLSMCLNHNNRNDCPHSKHAGVVCSASSVVIIAGVAIAVLIILSALLIIFLVKKRKKTKKLQKYTFSNDAVNVQDVLQNGENDEVDYEIVDMDDRHHEDHEDSDSEPDYVNADKEDSDSDPDYVNVESNDSDQDYVNVTITEEKIICENNCYNL